MLVYCWKLIRHQPRTEWWAHESNGCGCKRGDTHWSSSIDPPSQDWPSFSASECPTCQWHWVLQMVPVLEDPGWLLGAQVVDYIRPLPMVHLHRNDYSGYEFAFPVCEASAIVLPGVMNAWPSGVEFHIAQHLTSGRSRFTVRVQEWAHDHRIYWLFHASHHPEAAVWNGLSGMAEVLAWRKHSEKCGAIFQNTEYLYQCSDLCVVLCS